MWIAIEYSYKLGQKNEFKFWCELGWFLQRQSHLLIHSANNEQRAQCLRQVFDLLSEANFTI